MRTILNKLKIINKIKFIMKIKNIENKLNNKFFKNWIKIKKKVTIKKIII
jgi:hypothetical protein